MASGDDTATTGRTQASTRPRYVEMSKKYLQKGSHPHRAAKYYPERVDAWTASILDKKPTRLATVAMANKTARSVWAVLSRNEPYKQPNAA